MPRNTPIGSSSVSVPTDWLSITGPSASRGTSPSAMSASTRPSALLINTTNNTSTVAPLLLMISRAR